MNAGSRPGCYIVLTTSDRYEVMESFQTVQTQIAGRKPHEMIEVRDFITSKALALRVDAIASVREGGY